MFKKFTLCALLLTALVGSGCGTYTSDTQNRKQVVVNLQNQYDAAYARKQMRPGNSAVIGTAFLRKGNGEVVTAAGCTVYLTPVTLYATERIQAIYGNTTRKFLDYRDEKNIKFVPDEPSYLQNEYQAVADAQGLFKFVGIADGQYYVSVTIMWNYGLASKAGGSVMQRVTVQKGAVQEVTLSN